MERRRPFAGLDGFQIQTQVCGLRSRQVAGLQAAGGWVWWSAALDPGSQTQAQVGWVLGWAGLGWAGLGWAGLQPDGRGAGRWRAMAGWLQARATAGWQHHHVPSRACAPAHAPTASRHPMPPHPSAPAHPAVVPGPALDAPAAAGGTGQPGAAAARHHGGAGGAWVPSRVPALPALPASGAWLPASRPAAERRGGSAAALRPLLTRCRLPAQMRGNPAHPPTLPHAAPSAGPGGGLHRLGPRRPAQHRGGAGRAARGGGGGRRRLGAAHARLDRRQLWLTAGPGLPAGRRATL